MTIYTIEEKRWTSDFVCKKCSSLALSKINKDLKEAETNKILNIYNKYDLRPSKKDYKKIF